MLGDRINEIRELKGLGLNELAKMAGISGSYLSNIEKNIKNNPSMEVLKNIANALNVNVDDFFKEDDIMNKSADEISKEFKELMPKIEKLSKNDKEMIKQMIDRLIKD